MYKIKVKTGSALFVSDGVNETAGELAVIGRAVSTLTGLGWAGLDSGQSPKGDYKCDIPWSQS